MSIETVYGKARQFYGDFIKKHPDLKEEAEDYFQLMLDEIDAGESAENEYAIFIESCEDLITD